MAGRVRDWNAVDRAMVHLVRIALADDWHPVTAAARLRALVGDPRILRRVAARVDSAIADRPSEVAERAAATLQGALAGVEPA